MRKNIIETVVLAFICLILLSSASWIYSLIAPYVDTVEVEADLTGSITFLENDEMTPIDTHTFIADELHVSTSVTEIWIDENQLVLQGDDITPGGYTAIIIIDIAPEGWQTLIDELKRTGRIE